VLSVAWSPDGSRLATASEDGTALVWDARTGQPALVLRGHGYAVFSVCWSPDGERLATASLDATARVWDARTGQEALVLRGPGGGVQAVSWSPDGERLATASDDKTARVWDARTKQPGPGGYDPWAEDEARRNAWAPDWHADDAETAARAGDAFAAAFHVTRLRQLAPAGARRRVRRGLLWLRLGYRNEGLADLAHPDVAPGADTQLLHWHALACLARGDRAGYRAACADALVSLGDYPEPWTASGAAWVSCLGPGAPDPGAALALAEKAVAERPDDHKRTLGAALFRAGRPEEAVGRLEEALKLRRLDAVHEELLLALACQKLGRNVEARRWLAKAQTWMDRYRGPARALGTLGAGPAGVLPALTYLVADRPDPRAAGSDANLLNWLEMEVLRAEAEAALAAPPGKP
jgi:tetratricopeptide (TPR) repeat protein